MFGSHQQTNGRSPGNTSTERSGVGKQVTLRNLVQTHKDNYSRGPCPRQLRPPSVSTSPLLYPCLRLGLSNANIKFKSAIKNSDQPGFYWMWEIIVQSIERCWFSGKVKWVCHSWLSEQTIEGHRARWWLVAAPGRHRFRSSGLCCRKDSISGTDGGDSCLEAGSARMIILVSLSKATKRYLHTYHRLCRRSVPGTSAVGLLMETEHRINTRKDLRTIRSLMMMCLLVYGAGGIWK